MDNEEQLISARKAIRESLVISLYHVPATRGYAWKRVLESLAFGTPLDLPQIQHFDATDRERFQTIITAFSDGVLPVEDIRSAYLEFFPEAEVMERL